MPSSSPVSPRRLAGLAVVAGLGLGAAVVARTLVPRPFEEHVLRRPPATPADVAVWRAERDRRGPPLETIPDPPGSGEVVTVRYWASLPGYDLEMKRRGARVTLGIHGVDSQTDGSGWTAFGEGSASGEAGSFRGAVATIAWSCVGLRHRRSSMGVARMTFSPDGRTFEAIFLQSAEFLRIPVGDTYVKASGRIAIGPRPAYGELLGQIPYTRALSRHADDATYTVSGLVRERDGAPLADVPVQLQGVDATRVHTDEHGAFRLRLRGRDAPWTQTITAGAIGHRNGQVTLFHGDPTTGLVVELERLDMGDHPEYAWRQPSPYAAPDDAQACGTCHPWQFTEWSSSRHARMADNGHVLDARARMLRAKAGPDDCAACHEPAYAAQTGRTDYATRDRLASNHCDFCHKIRHTADVRASGVLGSLVLARPDPLVRDRPGDIHRVFGTAPDVTYAYMGASYNPYLGTSHLCAGCHQGGGAPGRPKVDTFEEWRRWAAAREGEGFRSCQDCHMPGGTTKDVEGRDVDEFAFDALHRRAEAVHSHAFEGTGRSFAGAALDVQVVKRLGAGGDLETTVTLTNVGAGHSIPTGTPAKHVLVGIYARIGERWLAARPSSPRARVGEAAAPDEPLAAGDWRDPPGTVLGVFDRSTGALAADFWSPPEPADVDDRRLQAGASVALDVAFEMPADLRSARGASDVVVEVRVLHRRMPLPGGAASLPFEPRPFDAPPEVEWARIVR